MRAWSGLATMYWPSMMSLVPPTTPRRNVPPVFGVPPAPVVAVVEPVSTADEAVDPPEVGAVVPPVVPPVVGAVVPLVDLSSLPHAASPTIAAPPISNCRRLIRLGSQTILGFSSAICILPLFAPRRRERHRGADSSGKL